MFLSYLLDGLLILFLISLLLRSIAKTYSIIKEAKKHE